MRLKHASRDFSSTKEEQTMEGLADEAALGNGMETPAANENPAAPAPPEPAPAPAPLPPLAAAAPLAVKAP
jgi:hypothetical protein